MRILKEEDRRAASRLVQVQHDDAVRTMGWKEANGFADVSAESFQRLSEKVTLEMSEAERAQMASDKNQERSRRRKNGGSRSIPFPIGDDDNDGKCDGQN